MSEAKEFYGTMPIALDEKLKENRNLGDLVKFLGAKALLVEPSSKYLANILLSLSTDAKISFWQKWKHSRAI